MRWVAACFAGLAWAAAMLFAIPGSMLEELSLMPCAGGCGKKRPRDDEDARWRGWATLSDAEGGRIAVCSDCAWKPGAWRARALA